MTRRGRHKPQVGVALFPFLAVLICTMGALIVLLLLLVQQARVDASTLAKDQAPEKVDEAALTQRLEDADWRRQILEQQRLERAQALTDQRLALAHLEDHIRRLQDQWKDLETQAAQLATQDDAKERTRENVANQLAELAQQIEKARRDLEEARRQSADKPRSYCIIPYDGPNGTSRRPIYIECVDEAVILQPEGVRLEPRDFDGPLGPGNPLDASLRAIREYLARNPELSKHGEPYPLLVVRPSGVLAYAAARAAMKSWDDEFGYELIENDTKLAFPEPDPTLRAIVERAIVDARRRQQLLIAAAPSRFRGTVAGGGGGAGTFRSIVPVESFGEGELPGAATGSQAGVGPGGGQAFSGARGGFYGQQGDAAAGSSASDQGQARSGSRQQSSAAGSSEQAGRAAGGRHNSNAKSGPGGASSAGDPHAATAAGPSLSFQGGDQDGSQYAQPLAHQKGANWGLPNYSAKATAITRPIRIRVENERLMIIPAKGERGQARLIEVDQSMARATEALVAGIWDHVDTWGIAVANGYWKPVLYVEVAPGADARFAELQTLLDGSGLEVRRRSP